MLTSPTSDANGYCNLFSSTDFANLKNKGPKRTLACEANEWMIGAEAFLSAYGHRLGETISKKIVNALQVRMVMVVHGKKFETRASFSSLEEVAREFHRECRKADPLISEWQKLPKDSSKGDAKAKAANVTTLRETAVALVGDALLAEKGFVVDQVIFNELNDQYKIKTLNADQKTITCTLVEAAPRTKGKVKPDTTIRIDRAVLMAGSTWQCSSMVKAMFLTDIPSPLDCFELQASIIAGMVKNAMALEFKKSTEGACWLQRSPDVKLFAAKKMKEGALKLVALTNHVYCFPVGKDVAPSFRPMGGIDGFCNVYYKGGNSTIGENTPSAKDMFISKFFSASETHDQGMVNCMPEEKEEKITVLGQKLVISIPMIVNSKALAEEDEIVSLKTSAAAPATEAQSSGRKRQRRK